VRSSDKTVTACAGSCCRRLIGSTRVDLAFLRKIAFASLRLLPVSERLCRLCTDVSAHSLNAITCCMQYFSHHSQITMNDVLTAEVAGWLVSLAVRYTPPGQPHLAH